MSNRLGGKQGTAYLGTNANQPPNWTFSDRDPNAYDVNNVSLGDMWLNKDNEDVWILVSLAGDPSSKGSLATWSKIESGGIGILDTLTGNVGGAVSSTAGNINVVGDGIGIAIVGNPGTSTLTASLVAGIGAQSFTTDSGTATPLAGVLNIITDSASVNSGSTFNFSGSGNTVKLNTTDANDNTIVGKSSGNAAISGGDNTILGENSGISLTSGDDNTIIGGNSGNSITSGSNNILLGSNSGTLLGATSADNTVIGSTGFAGAQEFVGITAGSTVLHNYPGTDTSTTNGGNIFLGTNAGNFTLAGAVGDASNNGIGSDSLQSLTSGARNNAMGSSALTKITTGINNIAVGHNAGFNSGGNTGLASGDYNILVGHTAGSSYTAAESNNILLGVVSGTAAESNSLRIGSATGIGTGQLNKSFISGIRGITPTINDGIPVFINSVGQLGTVGTGGTIFVQTATGNSGGVVGPIAGNINIVGDGVTATVVGNPGTHTLTISALGGGGGTVSQLSGDTGSALPVVGIINVITNNAAQQAGSSVLFSGAGNNLTLQVSDANDNTIIGNTAGNATLTGSNNTAVGFGCINGLTTGLFNTVLGFEAGNLITAGSSNVLIGAEAAPNLLTGTFNVILGTTSGSVYTTNESSNILINSVGIVADSNTLHIGSSTGVGSGQLNKSFIHGIRGITPAINDGIPVFINSVGQLATVGNGATTMIQTVTGNAGGAVGPALGNINIVGDGATIQITGNPGTNTLTVVGLGGGGGNLSILTGDDGLATAAGGTINVITDNASQGAGSSVFFSGTGNTLTLEVTDADDNTLIGFGAGNATLTGSNNISLGGGSATGLSTGSSNIFLGVQAGSLITSGNNNLLCGDASSATMLKGTSIATGLYGFGVGSSVFLHNFGGIISGNTFVGANSAGNFNVGQQSSNKNNTGCGASSLSLITIGNNNSVLGRGAGAGITTGSFNTLLGTASGINYTSSESSNISIGYSTVGTVAESNTLRIGVSTGSGTGQINRTFISGIRGITTGISNAVPVVIDSAGQLGTAGGSSVITTLTANSGGAVSATGGNINVRGEGTYLTIAGNPGTSTLTASTTGLVPKTITGNTGGAVPASGGNITIRGDGSSVNVAGNIGTNTLTISAVGGAAGPSFFAYLNTTSPNVTGGTAPGVLYTIIYDTLPYNSGGAFNLFTSTFTAPVTGLYNFSWGVLCATPLAVALNRGAFVTLNTTSKNFQSKIFPPIRVNVTTPSAQPYMTTTTNVYVNMTAGDTAFVTIQCASSSVPNINLDGVIGTVTTGIVNFFSGELA